MEPSFSRVLCDKITLEADSNPKFWSCVKLERRLAKLRIQMKQ